MPGRVVETFQGGLESIQARGESLCTSSFSCSTEFDLGRTNMFYGGYNGRNNTDHRAVDKFSLELQQFQ